jgi:hypothetical protein
MSEDLEGNYPIIIVFITFWFLQASYFSLPCVLKTVAVYANNLSGGAGLLVWDLKDVIRSNTTWKCKGSADSGWMLRSFNDSTWAAAVYKAAYTTGMWGSQVTNAHGPTPNSSVHWIWSSSGDAYCRLSL